jgi:citrate lyase beta subunit
VERRPTGIVAVQGQRLDRAYIAQWAAYLKVADLAEQALGLG